MIALVIVLGLVFGSAVTCMSYRLPLGIDAIRKPSYCPQCDAVLRITDLWPVFSWCATRGRCRHCAAVIPWRYPLIEATTAILFLLIYLQYGASYETALLCLMTAMLMVMIVVDLEHYLIPDSVHVLLIPLALAYRILQDHSWHDIALSTLLMGGLALLLHYGYSALRGRVMLGFGDVKFFAVAGMWLSPLMLVPFLFLAGLLGILLGIVWRILGRGEIFPFGPALATSLFICLVYQEQSNIMYYMMKMYLLYIK